MYTHQTNNVFTERVRMVN